MLHYPPVLRQVCKYCGAEVTLERQGDGRPWRGRLAYSYTSDHHCPESDKALATLRDEHSLLEDVLFRSP
jgi:hypothetical protein